MDLKTFEEIIIIAKRHGVTSLRYEDTSINIESDVPDFPSYDQPGTDEDMPEPKVSDYLLTNPMMR